MLRQCGGQALQIVLVARIADVDVLRDVRGAVQTHRHPADHDDSDVLFMERSQER